MRKGITIVLLALSVVVLLAGPVAALDLSPADIDYVLDEEGEKIYIPQTYQLESMIGDFGGALNNPKDLFIDAEDNLYIADTGNNRIVKLDASWAVAGAYTGDSDKAFMEPTGIYVREDGQIYVADYGNSRISVMTPEGEHVRDYLQPESDLLGDLYEFRPSKVGVNAMNDVYLIMGKNFMMLDEDGEFKGYIGAENVAFSFSDLIVRMFASEAQREKLARAEPPAYNNFTMGPSDRLYAVALGQNNQIKVINSVGNNIYKSGEAYGEQSKGATGSWIIPAMLDPNFVDIAVDDRGIITAVDQISCKVYQYDTDGNLLTVFGGKGTVKGYFGVPTSLAMDSKGRVYVLDASSNQIHVFRPTSFIEDVHEAIYLYNDGQYDNAQACWERIARLNTGYPLAEQSLGDIYFKQKKYPEAMARYRTIGNREDYTKAYGLWLHDLIAGKFLVVALSLIAGVILILFGIARFKRLAGYWCDDLFGIVDPEKRPRRKRKGRAG